MNRVKNNCRYFLYELRISAEARKKLEVNDTFFANDGRFVIADFKSVRKLAYNLNRERATEDQVYPGTIFAAGLLHEIYHILLRKYEEKVQKDIFEEAAKLLEQQMGTPAFAALATDFTNIFPPTEVYRKLISPAHYLKGKTGNKQHISIAIEEMMMLSLAHKNRACKKITTLFDRSNLNNQDQLDDLLVTLESYFKTLPPFGKQKRDIFSLLLSPLLHAPDDLYAQLDYILINWKDILPESLLEQILRSKDLMKEDMHLSGAFGPPPTFVPRYKKEGDGTGMFLGKSGYDPSADESLDYEEAEQFTEDTDWMPRVVLLAKNAYVWMDQLSKKYQRDIRTLDQIPDKELDQLARWNFNGLWLIGIWERSNASKKIKHLTGNTDAVASAYSLYDYEIARDLGGEEAYQKLNEKAKQRGIRLASDMVPNHTGVFSRWVIENPDYFIQSPVPPFPGYSFTRENLSDDPNIEIRIEDGYYNKTDAAVVFQRIDRNNNDIRYLYHGNDGTMMPWNDTAQLDMIKAEVRAAVIEKIFDVARRFSIIRFDAAMTLAKKHFARLWYPRPGTGGDIPSRADHALSKEAFDTLFPLEFWREVVDRINNELPETLLLAEAFWFMEGYFVRTLGMHRVYNSAFMHMLKNEENEKYRDLISNTLEFEPEILKRYVNFMSNPDEETALQQFGTGDKYFGVCVMMNTLPGLPMFAHGQIEGYTEKYGMEYQRAYYNELPKHWLIEQHEREIFPLTARRYLFSGVANFNLFNFLDPQGVVNENVFAYTNRFGNERAIVLYNNKYDGATGHIKTSAPRLAKAGDEKGLISHGLADALGLDHGGDAFYIVRELISDQEYLLSGEHVHQNGLYRQLRGFEYRVFWDFREVRDKDGSWATLFDSLQGQGVPSVEERLALQRLKNTHLAFLQLFNSTSLNCLLDEIREVSHEGISKKLDQCFQDGIATFIKQSCKDLDHEDKSLEGSDYFAEALETIFLGKAYFGSLHNGIKPLLVREQMNSPEELFLLSPANNYKENSIMLASCFVIRSLMIALKEYSHEELLFEKLLLHKPLTQLLAQSGKSADDVASDITLLEILLKYGTDPYDFFPHQTSKEKPGKKSTSTRRSKASMALEMLNDTLVRRYIGVNEHEGTVYFSKEGFEQLNKWLFNLTFFAYAKAHHAGRHTKETETAVKESVTFFFLARRLSANSGYKLQVLTDGLSAMANINQTQKG